MFLNKTVINLDDILSDLIFRFGLFLYAFLDVFSSFRYLVILFILSDKTLRAELWSLD